MKQGAFYRGGGECEFIVWAPLKEEMTLKLMSSREMCCSMDKKGEGYWYTRIKGIKPGERYVYTADGVTSRPDPASFYQPEGVHNPSAVFDHTSFQWEDDGWKGIPLHDMIMYELHTGTFSERGTLDGVADKIGHFKDLGINAVELMPLAQFPGARNWGYDGVHPFAVQNTYGGPPALKKLVNEFHKQGIAVILDVVYNHLGPEGNYLAEFGPYFTDKYKTPWGWAINYDDKYSGGVREYFIQNMLYWFEYFHVDALRLDAIHGIFDFSAKHILDEMKERADEYCSARGRKHYLIAESDLNDSRTIRGKSGKGYNIDAQWLDDFHHSVRTLITDENQGYYRDFGDIKHFFKSIKEGFVYSWDYSEYRKKYFGSYSGDISPAKFIAFIQNHDQTGNRMNGERLTVLADHESLKLAAGAVFLSPYIPMLFMGEEYGETAPFLYFIDHSDKDLINAVRTGRKDEFKAFNWVGDPPDPKSEKTYIKSKLKWESFGDGKSNNMFKFYRKLINMRKEFPSSAVISRENYNAELDDKNKIIVIRRTHNEVWTTAILNFNDKNISWAPHKNDGTMRKIIDSSDRAWDGPGNDLPELLSCGDSIRLRRRSLVIYKKENEDE
ncbi:MAG: malto-oligosyltrehalose trehalohydrolase [Candidatus Omnitrophota bacterium]